VVEDEPLVRALAADVLEEAGFVVIEAPSADYAMVVLGKRSDVAVVFTDVEMPGHHNVPFWAFDARIGHLVAEPTTLGEADSRTRSMLASASRAGYRSRRR
jgi:CheY-like chemotaxis protein